MCNDEVGNDRDDFYGILLNIKNDWNFKYKKIDEMLCKLDYFLDLYINNLYINRGICRSEVIDILKELDQFSVGVEEEFSSLRTIIKKLVGHINNESDNS